MGLRQPVADAASLGKIVGHPKGIEDRFNPCV